MNQKMKKNESKITLEGIPSWLLKSLKSGWTYELFYDFETEKLELYPSQCFSKKERDLAKKHNALLR